ncbi:MAG: TolC family protein [Bacteroidota bacterium]
MQPLRYLCLLLLGFHFIPNGTAQPENLRLDLNEVIVLAQSDAPDVLLARTRLTNSYWRFQSFRADYRPQIDLTATLPDLNRSIEALTLPDGSDAFINRSLMTNTVGLSLTQDISATGGQVFAFTGLQRIDLFSSSTTSYLATPFVLGFSQPIFGFNTLKWNKKIEPLRYEEATRTYAEEMEQVAGVASNLFFDLLNAQLTLEAAETDKANADTLFNISKGRYSVGKIAETDLLQVELGVMNADARLAAAQLDQQTATEGLRNFLGITEAIIFDLVPPTEIPDFVVDADKAINYALQHRSETIAFERRLREADRDVAEAKAAQGLNINLNGRFGLTQTANRFRDAYKRPLDQEQLSVGLEVPIADWGKATSRMEIARSNRELEQMNVRQDRVNFEREILLKVQQFDLQRNQVRLALRAYEVAQKRQDITRKRYLIGKIDLTDLNLALREQDEARRSYISALQTFWLAYYELRRLCLYDFANDQPLFKRLEGY